MEARARRPATIESVEAFQALVSGFAREHGVPPPAVSAVELALEEALVNIANYAYPDAAGDAEVACRIENACLVVEIRDWGAAFDPLQVPPPDRAGTVEARPIGGLGIHLMRQIMDEVRYRREDGCNHLTLVKRLA